MTGDALLTASQLSPLLYDRATAVAATAVTRNARAGGHASMDGPRNGIGRPFSFSELARR